MKTLRSILSLSTALALVACGSSSSDTSNPADDTGTTGDSSVADSGRDTNVTDSTTTDSTATDSTKLDSTTTDSGTDVPSGDTGGDATDTTAADTGLADTTPSCDAAPIEGGSEAGLTACGSSCTDLTKDPANCGACGKTCDLVSTCVAGGCAKCTAGEVACSNVCTDITSDNANCGACAHACAASEACSGGTCVCAGFAGERCFGACVDTNTDVKNCGGCGIACGAGFVCDAGTCACPRGLSDCSGTCVDEKWDNKHCGGCATACTAPSLCSLGTCATSCGGGRTACGGSCIDTTSDPANCGGCAVACGATAPYCRGGSCKAGYDVLFYAPDGDAETTEQAYLPVGAKITAADEKTWRSMTTADFSKYAAIIVGDVANASPGQWTSTKLQALFDTRAAWGPAVTGRIIVQGADPAWHAKGPFGGPIVDAQTYLKAAMTWIVGGKGTALYVSSDWGARNLDFMSPFGTFADKSASNDDIHVVDTSSPVMIGSSDSTFSGWGTTAHSVITTWPSAFHLVADVAITGGDGGLTNDPTQAIVLTRDSTVP